MVSLKFCIYMRNVEYFFIAIDLWSILPPSDITC